MWPQSQTQPLAWRPPLPESLPGPSSGALPEPSGRPRPGLTLLPRASPRVASPCLREGPAPSDGSQGGPGLPIQAAGRGQAWAVLATVGQALRLGARLPSSPERTEQTRLTDEMPSFRAAGPPPRSGG